MAADGGATSRELLIEACRRNNTDLLEEVISDLQKSASGGDRPEGVVAKTLNNTQDGIGNGLLHIAAANGNYEILDTLLDQEGLEIEGLDRMEKDTPLHKAVRYTNGLDMSIWSEGVRIVDILLDAGCDPRIKNKAKLKPMDLVDPRNQKLRDLLQNAEFTFLAGNDIVQDDDDRGPTGSASDSE